MYRYDLGIIGGMGSDSTVEIFRRIVNRTSVSCDQDHMKICILNNSIIPDRTKCIVNGEESPLPYINESIEDLENINAKYFIVGCNTAHYFVDGFKFTNIKFINMIEETLDLIHKNYKDKKICVLSTYGTINARVYHNHQKSEGLNFVFANLAEQERIMNIIINTKSGMFSEKLLVELLDIIKGINLRENNCLFVLACTELSLYLENVKKEVLAIDAMDCLVNSAILKCGYKIKE